MPKPEPTDRPPPASTAASTSRRLRVAAVAILVLGLLASTGVWLVADDDAAIGPGTTYRITGGRIDAATDRTAADRQTERLGGRALVRTAAFDRWLGSLWHGRRLAWTLAVLAVGVAAACAAVAALNDSPVDE